MNLTTNPNTKPPPAYGPVPSARQLRWHELQTYGFVHFTVNTFTGKEWGYGDEDPGIFYPSQLDARQWARVARNAGLKGLILTAKHHDGFCLWPSRYATHSVANSPWKDGKGDVVREFSEACGEFGIKMGLYLSPWDRNHADYGKRAYVTYYHKQLEELLTNYGEVFEVWHDGANGGTGYYGGAREEREIDRRTYYGFPEIWELVREVQPEAVIFSDAGPDVRWIGNEKGYAPDRCWARIDPEGIYPGMADETRLAHGNPDGTVWRPAEVDVSIRNGWFFHENEKPKSLAQLLDIYYDSVGKGCCLLLNVPPDKSGLFHEADVKRLLELRTVLDQTFKHNLAQGKPTTASNERGKVRRFSANNATDGDGDTYWATDDGTRRADLIVDLGGESQFNRICVREYIPLGQRIASFAVDVRENEGWRQIAEGETIGARRILRVPKVNTDRLRLRITKALACPVISSLEIYMTTSEGSVGDI